MFEAEIPLSIWPLIYQRFRSSMAPYSLLVTGANRGIGLGLVKEFLKNEAIQYVIATARHPSNAKAAYLYHSLFIYLDG
ncbi:hypothetical protein KIN20_029707 [Parelaphostrongylus tenuis]|uniref:Uncharacterized protein n=1 Tax=Parelaphostrongylus tenuis TaxID=148309 RepID=A0AAD5R2U0_PARTN|nr:hypothetical protein KIN20_029707 [Parelaphostrongylus tenuis]